jgi:hypothetical protein
MEEISENLKFSWRPSVFYKVRKKATLLRRYNKFYAGGTILLQIYHIPLIGLRLRWTDVIVV